MSDAKWRKLIAAIKANRVGIQGGKVKVVGTADPHFLLFNDHWPYVASPKFLDTFDLGGIAFSEIEWLEFPALLRTARALNLPHLETKQDIEALYQHLNGIGQFPLEFKPESLRIVGYLH